MLSSRRRIALLLGVTAVVVAAQVLVTVRHHHEHHDGRAQQLQGGRVSPPFSEGTANSRARTGVKELRQQSKAIYLVRPGAELSSDGDGEGRGNGHSFRDVERREAGPDDDGGNANVPAREQLPVAKNPQPAENDDGQGVPIPISDPPPPPPPPPPSTLPPQKPPPPPQSTSPPPPLSTPPQSTPPPPPAAVVDLAAVADTEEPPAETTAAGDVGVVHVQQDASAEEDHAGTPDGGLPVPDGAPAQTCPANRRVVYLKTHKTGSSTLTNILHRYALKYRLLPVLPKGNLFLAWPAGERLMSSFVPLPEATDGQYDVLCSAHHRYNRPLLDRLVPGAGHITVLRHPLRHFVSSWNYWATGSHIRQTVGREVTMHEFLADPEAWWGKAKKGDFDLLSNNAMFDLGYDTHALREADVAAAEALLDTFAVVMITEHLDESLVLLKRRLCLDLEDIVYYALKVNARRPAPAPLSAAEQATVLRLDWADWRLYQRYNRSLWAGIEAEGPGFAADLAALRARKAWLSGNCSATAPYTEDQHRFELLRGGLAPWQVRCHEVQLDSPGFVMYLKHRYGVGQPECHTQGKPRRQLVFIKLHKVGGSTLANIFHRFGLKEGLRFVLPKNNLYLGWSHKETLASSYVRLPPSKDAHPRHPAALVGDRYNILCSAHAIFQYDAMRRLVPDALFITAVRDPVAHFVSSWNYWGVAARLQSAAGRPVGMLEFLQDPAHWLPLAGVSAPKLIHNSMAFDLGITSTPTPAQVDGLIALMHRTFANVLITERMDESLVLMRRSLCWAADDILHTSLKVKQNHAPDQARAAADVPADVQRLIRKFNWADERIYAAFLAEHQRRVGREILFQEEVRAFQAEVAEAARVCAPWQGLGDDGHRKALLEGRGLSPAEVQCHKMQLDSAGFVKYLKALNGVGDDECHTQGRPQSKVAFIKPHKAASSTLLNILHRYMYKNKVRVAVPANDLFLGWPDKGSVIASTVWDGKETFGFFGSGHTVYDRKAIETLVPGARYLTILRRPTEHFRSSWRHWHVADHIVAGGGPRLTMAGFLADPAQYWPHSKFTDRILLENSQAYDLGLPKGAGEAEAQALARHLQTSFDLVLLADYMDESLVLLRRVLCWPFEDVVHLSIKVTAADQKAARGGDSGEAALDAAIRRFNWADQTLYDSANRTFWSLVGRQVGFQAEVRRLQDARQRLEAGCRQFSQLEESQHRRELMQAGGPGGAHRLCHLSYLDSKGFVRLFKERQGVPYRECMTSLPNPLLKVVQARLPFVADDTLAGIINRDAMRRGLALALPRDLAHLQLTSPFRDSIVDARQRGGGGGGGVVRRHSAARSLPAPSGALAVLSGPYFAYDRPQLEALVPGARFVLAVADPVHRFVRAWRALGVEALLRDRLQVAIGLEDFAANPDQHSAKLPEDIRAELFNGMAFGLGLASDITAEQAFAFLDSQFPLVLLDNSTLEAQVLLRRLLCWESPAVRSLSTGDAEAQVTDISASSRAAIEAMNKADVRLYQAAKRHYARTVSRQVGLAAEVALLQDEQRRLREDCAPILRSLLQAPQSRLPPRKQHEADCYLASLSYRNLAIVATEATQRQRGPAAAAGAG